jgi:beta-glucosidase
LPVSFPRSVGQIPLYYNHKNTGRPYGGNYSEPPSQRLYISRYRDIKNSALYPFGFGLSYTSFSYGDLTLTSNQLKRGEQLKVSISVTNTGSRDGEEVVQLYTRDVAASVTRPVKELKGFQKVMIKAGETKQIVFSITDKDLEFLKADMTWGTEPGKFEVFVGTDSEQLKKATFDLQ